MPPPGWLHVNGVSLSTDIQQPSDNRTKQMTSPIPPVLSSPNPLPFATTNQDRQHQKLENADLPKRLFLDRQIKKAKSLHGLIKGTALSHSSPSNTKPSATDEITSTTVPENDDESSPSQQIHEPNVETRRPRVSFSEFNKVQFFEDNDDHSQQSAHHRRRRHRSAKKSVAIILNTQVSPPSIQHSQTLYAPYRPLSRQQPIGHELNIRKQRLIPSPRAHTSRITHLPDILNQTMPNEVSSHEKFSPQREKTFYQFPEPNVDMLVNSSTEISRESTRAGGTRPTAMISNNSESNEFATNSFTNTSSISVSSTSRQRSNLRSISLRQQFTSPIRSKLTVLPNQTPPMIINPRRSASLKNTIARNHSLDDTQEELSNQNLENRPMTGINSSKHLKRNYMIHFNSKYPFNGNSTNDSIETNRHSTMKANFHGLSPERFQNVLKIVRPPYITNLHSSHQDPSLQTTTTTTTTTNHINGSIRSSRTTSGHASHDYHITTNTIFV